MNVNWKTDLMYNSRIVILAAIFPVIFAGRMLYDLKDVAFPSRDFLGTVALAVIILTVPVVFIYRYFVDVHAPRTGARRIVVLFLVWFYWWVIPLAILAVWLPD